MRIHNLYVYGTFFLALNLQAETQIIGATYAIAEPDALEEIRQTAVLVNWEKHLESSMKSATADWVSFPEATEDRSRNFTPVYVTPFDVTDKDGKLLYPRGFRYNVLEHVNLPMRIVVFNNEPHQLEWVRENRKETDILLLADTGLHDVIKDLGTTVYLMSDKIALRLGIEKVPSIVEQHQQHFLIREFNLEHTLD